MIAKNKNRKRVDWAAINTVLLDMDGTLIDKHHDDYFWNEAVPAAYAKKNKMPVAEAREKLFKIYASNANTSKWADFDFWEKELEINLWELKRSTANLVKLHPHTLRFLKFIRKRVKNIYLVTAAQRKDIDFKMSQVCIRKYFDGVYSEVEIGKSKKDLAFWKILGKLAAFDKGSALFADDEDMPLKAAKAYGIKYLVFKAKSNSKKPEKQSKDFIRVRHFDDIL
jgi:FMN phosphatase YigB (HAD superfamily)